MLPILPDHKRRKNCPPWGVAPTAEPGRWFRKKGVVEMRTLYIIINEIFILLGASGLVFTALALLGMDFIEAGVIALFVGYVAAVLLGLEVEGDEN